MVQVLFPLGRFDPIIRQVAKFGCRPGFDTMPASNTVQLPEPKNWQEFQEMSVALFGEEWGDPNTKENGRSGQRQNGVDVYGQRDGKWCGVQCKGRRRWPPNPLKIAELEHEAAEARSFVPPLTEFTIATTAVDDAKLQTRARELTDENRKLGLFSVHVVGWGDFERRLCRHERLLAEFYGFLGYGHETGLKDHVTSEKDDLKAHMQDGLAALSAQMRAQVVQPGAKTGPDALATRGDIERLMDVLLASQGSNAIQNTMPPDTLSADKRSEDPGLHERLDGIRDLMEEPEPHLARRQLLALLPRAEGKPYALFRLKSNLASICLFLGELDEAISGYEEAFQRFPDEPHAKANLALARMFQGRFDESMVLAQEALDGPEPVEAAVGYLLQAASRSDWSGDPETLVPKAFRNGRHADAGLADFLRRRETPGWEQASLDLAARHHGETEFVPVEAVAALSMALNHGNAAGGGVSPIPISRLNQIADRMQAFVKRMLQLGYADAHDRGAHLNNACVLLRLCDRYGEMEELIRSAGDLADAEPNLRRLRALALLRNDKPEEAIRCLQGDTDPENAILYGDLKGTEAPAKGVEILLAVDDRLLDDRLRWMRWHVLAHLSLAAKDAEQLQTAVNALRAMDPGDPEAAAIDALSARLGGAKAAEVKAGLLKASALINPSSSLHARVFVAEQLRLNGLPFEASILLDDMIDLDRPSMPGQLYLASLAEARRDARFQAALARASATVRGHPFILLQTAQHAWCTGDLDAAGAAIDALILKCPDNLGARLFKIDLLGRMGRSDEVLAELSAPLETYGLQSKHDVLRLIGLLGHNGHLGRAGRLAYRLYLDSQNDPAAWQAIFRLIMDNAHHPENSLWECKDVGDDVAVDLTYDDDGGSTFFIVEPDLELCGKSAESLEPKHPLVRSVWGLSKGDSFTAPSGRTGTVTELRHKVVAQLHRVLRDFSDRFPDVRAFERLSVDLARPEGLDELKSFLQKRDVSSKEATASYGRGEVSIGMLALMFGTDQADAAARAIANEGHIKVAVGLPQERSKALAVLLDARNSGATLDHLSFWFAWCSGAMDVLKRVFGKIRVPRSVVDELVIRAAEAKRGMNEGRRSAMYRNSKIEVTHFSPDYVRGEVDHIGRALRWIQDNAEICPIVLDDGSPPALLEMYRDQRSPMMDALLVSRQTKSVYVSEDLWMRNLASALGHRRSVWLHAILQFAVARRILDRRAYVEMTASLIASGQSYIGVTANDLVDAVRLAPPGQECGEVFEILTRLLGGQNADMASQGSVVLAFLNMLWGDWNLLDKRKAATSLVVRRLLRGRNFDYGVVLRSILMRVRGKPELFSFLVYWTEINFIPPHEILGRKPIEAVRQPHGKRRKDGR